MEVEVEKGEKVLFMVEGTPIDGGEIKYIVEGSDHNIVHTIMSLMLSDKVIEQVILLAAKAHGPNVGPFKGE